VTSNHSMSSNFSKRKFIEEARGLIIEELSNENFGVSELAERMHMSRSNLLRKIKKETQKSASQFIREVRLQKGMELLKNTEYTVSEISYQVGFSNNSYFTKCFREYYGYSPGEARAKNEDLPTHEESSEKIVEQINEPQSKPKNRYYLFVVALVGLVFVGYFVFNYFGNDAVETKTTLDKSIAVLPFKNMSSDSSNLYFVNGLMESSLNNLQKIEDLRVISRTSVEKFRNSNKSASEIANELQVNYLVEGSGQRNNNSVLLNVQLIEASTDTPIWAEQYNYEIEDVFQLQNTIAKQIAEAIQAKITSEELVQIEKKPTENLIAYEYYLKGLDKLKLQTNEGLEEAIILFKKSIKKDTEFALAYAEIAFAYFYLDVYKSEKKYTSELNYYADKALLYDSKSAESLMAKALYYINVNEYKFAIPHLEKALEYNPNSLEVINFLSDIYNRVVPDTEKYLLNTLKGIQLNSTSQDSINQRYAYINLSNALIQNGFEEQALKYINLSLDYNPKNEYAPFLKIFIEHTKHKNISKTTRRLVKEWKKDTTRLDILQEVGKFYYMQEQYDSAFYYYQKFDETRKANQLNYYTQEDLKIGIAYEKMGYEDKAKEFFQSFSEYCANDSSIYQSASLATKYAHEGKIEKAIEQLKIFSTQDNFQYWIVLFLDKEPLMDKLRNHPEYKPTLKKIESKFWNSHDELKERLREEGLL